MSAPVITMPRSSDASDSLVVDLGQLKLSNAVTWHGASSPTDRHVRSHRTMAQPAILALLNEALPIKLKLYSTQENTIGEPCMVCSYFVHWPVCCVVMPHALYPMPQFTHLHPVPRKLAFS